MKNIYLTLALALLLISGNVFAGDLINAIGSNDIAKVKSLLADVKTRPAALAEADKGGYSPMIVAVRDNHIDMVRELINAGVNVNAPSGALKLTPLHSASNIDIVRLLIASNANVNAADNGGNTPLHSAVRNGRMDIMKLLIDANANVNLANIDGETPVYEASTPELAAMLLNAKANLNVVDKKGNSPLINKIISRQTEAAIWMINNHVSVEKANEDGDSPLHFAAKYGNDTVVDELIKKGAGIGITDNNGDTPLHLAATAPVVNLLIKAGAATDIMNKSKLIPVVTATDHGYTEAAMAMMTKANVKAANENGITLLHNFAGRGKVDAMKKLIELGADVNAVTNTVKQTPLHMATSKEAAELLLNNGAKIDTADLDGITPLMRALQNNNDALVEYLLQQKASVAVKTIDGDTPLHMARSIKAVNLILGADKQLLNAENKSGETPLFSAITDENKDAALALIAAGADVNKICGKTPIIDAAIAKAEKNTASMDVLKAIVDKKPDMTVLNDKNQKPISITRKTDIIMLLASNGADVNAVDLNGRTPLFFVVINAGRDDEKAAAKNNIESLLKIHANVNVKDSYGNTPLSYAPNVIVAKLLIENTDEKNRADINVLNKRDESLLYKVVADNRKDLVEYYIAKNLSVKQANNAGDSPLHRAASIVDPISFERDLDHPNPPAPHEIATMLIAAGADVNAKNNNGETPLFYARSASMITYLVKDCKADPNVASLAGDTALMRIVRTNKDAVSALINNGVVPVDVNYVSPAKSSNKKTALFMAQTGEIADLLIKAKATVNIKDADGMTPLHDAVKAGRLDVVKTLLIAGADPTVRSDDGNLPMHLTPNVDMATEILSAPKTDINAYDDSGNTLLHNAARKADGLKMVQLLMSKNASVIIANKNQESPLHLAANDAIFNELVKNGPTNINSKDVAGNTPMISMVRLGNNGAVAKLIELGADAKLKNLSGETAIDFASDFATAKLLFDKGADVKTADKSGMTPLLYAVKNSRLDVADFLLKNSASAITTVNGKVMAVKNNEGQNVLHFAGSQKMYELFADKIGVNTTDNRGRTPLYYAAKGNNFDMVKYLLDKKDIQVNTKVTPKAVPMVKGKKDTSQQQMDIEEGLTPLHVTSDPVIAQLLIDTKKIDINAKNAQGFTPLMYSLATGGKTVAVLLANGANVKMGNNNGMQPIHAATSADTIQILLKNGADVNAHDNTNSTPLHYAAQSFDVNWVKTLIANKATLNPVNNYGDSPLMLARVPEIVKVLIENGADCNAKNKMGYSKLHLAAATNAPEMLDILLAQPKINVNTASSTGSTPLFIAANVDNAKKLIEKGASVTIADNEKATPLHFFAANGRADMVALVLAELAKANNKTAINAKAINDLTPAYLAAANGKTEVMPLLIKAGADLNIPTTMKLGGSTPLMAAVNNNNIEMVKIIANAKGVDLNCKNVSGLTPLHWAAYKDYTKVIEILIAAKAKIDPIDNNNATPLFQAVSENHLDAVKLLVLAKTEVNFKAKNNVTPLMVSRSADVAAVLLANGASPNAARSDSVTPLNIAISNGDDKLARLLIASKADINIADSSGITPLHLAIAKDLNDLAHDLIARGATINTADKSKNTPLITAVQHGNILIATELIKKGANVNTADNYGGTPIHYADKSEIIKALIQGGAKINAALKNGLTPLHLAVLQNNPEKIKLLVANGASINAATPNKVTPIMIAMNMKNASLVNLLKSLGATEPKPQPAPPTPPVKTGKPATPLAPKKK
ncbi:MAG: ankyrin repeat domain-containing protein [bacterium]